MGYLERFQKKDLSKNPELLPNLRSYALGPEFRPIMLQAAQQALAAELVAHKGMSALQLYDQLSAQGFENTTQVIRMAAISAGLSPDNPAVQQILVEAFEAHVKKYVTSRTEVTQGITKTMFAAASEDPRPKGEQKKTWFQQVSDGFEKLW